MEALGGSIVWEIAECIVFTRNFFDLETAEVDTLENLVSGLAGSILDGIGTVLPTHIRKRDGAGTARS